jgi:hypothetical protein
MLCLHTSGILFDRKIRLNNLVSQTIAMSARLLHISIGIPSGPIALPLFILFKVSLTSYSWILHTNFLLRSSEEMSNSMDELPLSSLKSKYSHHLLLIFSSLVSSRSVSSLMHFTWMMSLVSSLYFWPFYKCPSPLPSYQAVGIVHHTSDPLLHSPPALRSYLPLCTTVCYPHSYQSYRTAKNQEYLLILI